jgi:hypothetical protein
MSTLGPGSRHVVASTLNRAIFRGVRPAARSRRC